MFRVVLLRWVLLRLMFVSTLILIGVGRTMLVLDLVVGSKLRLVCRDLRPWVRRMLLLYRRLDRALLLRVITRFSGVMILCRGLYGVRHRRLVLDRLTL